MKKFVLCLAFITFTLIGSSVLATETENEPGDIPSMTIEQFILMNKSKQSKVDIIKKNNVEMETLKNELKNKIVLAADKINTLRIEISQDNVVITDETLQELKELLQFLQDSKNTLETDVERTSAEIENILDLIMAKGMQLEQYDKLIEKQNEVIVKMKNIMATVERI
ncbi:MAG: hypothetical protein IJ217_05045 [Clostridia bacterium]|nr:hypothetical protein [Clostridia bacterium]